MFGAPWFVFQGSLLRWEGDGESVSVPVCVHVVGKSEPKLSLNCCCERVAEVAGESEIIFTRPR